MWRKHFAHPSVNIFLYFFKWQCLCCLFRESLCLFWYLTLSLSNAFLEPACQLELEVNNLKFVIKMQFLTPCWFFNRTDEDRWYLRLVNCNIMAEDIQTCVDENTIQCCVSSVKQCYQEHTGGSGLMNRQINPNMHEFPLNTLVDFNHPTMKIG